MKQGTHRILIGDVLAGLATLGDGSCQMCCTSPPYWGLRRYGNDPAELGQEATPEAYIARLVGVFHEVKRTMRDDGTLWINIGDSYSAYNRNRGPAAGLNKNYPDEMPALPSGHGLSCKTLKNKDLIGIPWMLAFALRQPYTVPTCVKSEIDRAWLAAMFDGEGCIGIRRFHSYRKEKQQAYQDGFVVYTVVTNNDIELLDRCVELTGLGKTALKQSAGATDGRGIVSRRDSHGWRQEANGAVDVIRAVYPYLIAKRKQAGIAYTLDLLNKNGHGSRAVPQEVQEKKKLLWELIKRCNQRESVDLPNWIEEPKQDIRPGWYLRGDHIWGKPNGMPESVEDRPTRGHEYVFLLSKSERYTYDHEAVRTAPKAGSATQLAHDSVESRKARAVPTNKSAPTNERNGIRPDKHRGHGRRHAGFNERWDAMEKEEQQAGGANLRSIWWIPPAQCAEAHFAVMPERVAEICIRAGCPVGGTVLDPFCGSGTVGAVACPLGRNFIGCELYPEYAAMTEDRIGLACRPNTHCSDRVTKSELFTPTKEP